MQFSIIQAVVNYFNNGQNNARSSSGANDLPLDILHFLKQSKMNNKSKKIVNKKNNIVEKRKKYEIRLLDFSKRNESPEQFIEVFEDAIMPTNVKH